MGGKLEILNSEKNNTYNNFNELLPTNSTVILNDFYEKKYFENYEVFSIYEFCEFILRKSPLVFYPQTLSKTAGIFIINSLIKNIFKKNSALFNLTKSNTFAQELYQLFGKFLDSEITPDILNDLLHKIELDTEDNERFKLIIETFQKYLSKLMEIDYIDKRDLCRYSKNLLEQYPQYLENIRQIFPNIIFDKIEKKTFTQKQLFQTINTKIYNIETKTVTNNDFATALSKKYLQETITTNNEFSQSRLIEFNDIRDEAIFIAEEIIKKVKNEQLKYKDFTIVTSSQSTAKTINDVFCSANIPTNFTETDKNYQNFLTKLLQYFNICNGLKELEHSNLLKANYEQIHDEINLNFENIISETLENQFIKDKFIAIQQNLKETSLIKCVENNLNMLNAKECKKIQSELKKIKDLSELFNNGKNTEFIIYTAKFFNEKSTEFQKNLANLIKRINTIEKLSFTIENTPLSIFEIINIINSKTSNYNTALDGVNIVNLKNLKTVSCKEIYIVDLTEKSIPQKNFSTQFLSTISVNKITNTIKNKENNFTNIIKDDSELIKESAQKLVHAITLAKNNVTLTNHKYEDKKQIAPSIFFEYLKAIFPQNILRPEDNKEKTTKCEQTSLNLSLSQNGIIISDNDVLKLSPSDISCFQSCPRKYYFSCLLGLNETGTFAATYGTIVHAIMEIFNRKYLDSYSKETLNALSEKLFAAATNSQDALAAGFSQRIIDKITATDLLSLEEMKTQFFSAINELHKHAFFENIPDEVISEKSFNFTIPQLHNITFSGRIDAIYRFKDKYQIVDFKTGQTKPELNYLISENGITFKTKTGKITNIETKQNEYEYQIPIYYLACQNAPELSEFKDKISALGLLYIRPKNKDDGFKKDFIDSEFLEKYLPEIIKNLNNTIIAKIRNQQSFPSNYNERICEKCSFKYLCDTIGNAEDSDE